MLVSPLTERQGHKFKIDNVPSRVDNSNVDDARDCEAIFVVMSSLYELTLSSPNSLALVAYNT